MDSVEPAEEDSGSSWNPKIKRRALCKISLEEKIEILHRVLIKNEAQREVAIAMRVKAPMICALVRKAKRNGDFIQELR
jgi:hypothetical protein